MADSVSLAEVRKAKQNAHAVFSKLADVVGIGITSIGSGYGLKVNLSRAPDNSNELPKEVDGVPVRVEVVGSIHKQNP